MKRTLLIGMLLWGLVVALVACDTAKSPEPDTQNTVQTDVVTVEETTQISAEDTAAPTTAANGESEAEPEDTAAEEDTSGATSEETATVGTEASTESSSVEDTESPTEDATGAPVEETTDESTESPTEELTEAPTEADTTEEMPEAPSEEETTEAETDPAVKQPGKLIYSYNEELTYLNNMGEEIGTAFSTGEYVSWKREITVGKDQVAVFVDEGWVAFSSTEYRFGYIVNGVSYFSDSYAREAESSVVNMATSMGATNCARYHGGLTVEALQMGTNTVQFCVMLDEGVLCYLREYTVTLTQNPVKLDGTYWSVEMEHWEVLARQMPGVVMRSSCISTITGFLPCRNRS